MLLSLDDEHTSFCDASILSFEETLFVALWKRRCANIKEELNRARHLVDVLPSRSLCLDGLYRDLLLGNAHSRRDPNHRTPRRKPCWIVNTAGDKPSGMATIGPFMEGMTSNTKQSIRAGAGLGRFLELKNREPLNKGHSRLVFEHPDDPTLIVKVIRPDVVEDRFGKGTPWYKRLRRYGRFLSYAREAQEFIAVHNAHGNSPPFLQRVVGFVETDYGLGLITGAVRGRDGSIAPSLAMLIDSGRFDAEAQANLAAFIEEILACDVIISDMNLGNLVYAFDEERGDHFVLIDGLGNANLFPFKILSRRINRRSKRKRCERLHARIDRRLAKAGYPPVFSAASAR